MFGALRLELSGSLLSTLQLRANDFRTTGKTQVDADRDHPGQCDIEPEILPIW